MEKNYIGAFAIDIDETLADDTGIVSQKTADAIKKAKKLGYLVIISTTRGYDSSRDIAIQIGADFVCCNTGNMIVDAKGKTIYRNTFEKGHVKEFLDSFASRATDVIFDLEDGLCGKGSTIDENKWPYKKAPVSALYNTLPYKLCINSSETDEKYNQEIENFAKKYDFRCKKMRSGNMYLILQNSDKFFAVEKVMGWFGLSTDQLIVFGDDDTDKLSMQKAKTSVAVANSVDEILNIASHITSSNNESGVGEFIEKYIIKQGRTRKN